jgi:hypothetical protein
MCIQGISLVREIDLETHFDRIASRGFACHPCRSTAARTYFRFSGRLAIR